MNTDQVAVLVSAANEEQVERAAAKLRHYGKYSYLSFKDGRIQDKRITETEFGLQAQLVSLPAGIETSRSRTFDDIIAKLENFQVIYIGEGHTNYEDHLLQLEIIRALYKHDPNLAIGMEMFTRPTQPVLDRYMKANWTKNRSSRNHIISKCGVLITGCTGISSILPNITIYRSLP